MKKKKTNPRRIPLAKREIKNDALLEEAMQDDMTHAWLLVANTMVEQNHIKPKELAALSDSVNRYIKDNAMSDNAKKIEMSKAEKLMGVPNPCPHLDPDSVKSPIELERFRKKLRKVALHTALCVVCLGLAATKQFEDEDLRRIFLGVDLTQAEIERGINSYAEIEEYLKSQMIEIDVQNEDYCSIISDNSDN